MTNNVRYLEDFAVGDEITFGAYEVTEAEIIEFAEKYDPQPFHLDHEAAKLSAMGVLCASGWHTCAIAQRLLIDEFMKIGPSVGSPGCDALRWRLPVKPGDVLSVTTVVTELRPSRSKPGIGSAHHDLTARNQDGDIVMSYKSIAMFPLRTGSDEAK